ncbi:hypothetical protein AALK94_15565 [Bacteroides faecichinchillae]|uniref:hypothetical protein n=1 Tax=Bacteroides faecichinchillae TaxID=871325 RepID=UPI0035116445
MFKARLESRFLIAYIYLLLFGGWILKIGGVPVNIGLTVLSLIDILPLGVWIFSNPSFRLGSKNFFVDTLSFWLLWILVLILLLFSGYRHGGALIPSLIHWGALIRYIPLAYIVLSVNKYIDIGDKIIRQFKIVAIILIVIGYLCIILGDKATFFLPLLPENATGERETLVGNYSAVFANTIDYSFILIIFYIIFAYRANLSSMTLLGISLFFFTPIFKTGSAASVVVFIIIFLYRITNKHRKVRYSIVVIFLLLFIILGYKYWDLVMLVIENARLSRLGMLTLTLPDFLSEMSFDTLFGVGNDGYVVLDKVNGYKSQVTMLAYLTDGNISAFGDVFWVALLVFHGLLGLSIIVFLYYMTFRSVTNKQYVDEKYDYNQIVKCVYFSIVMLSFLNQIIVVRSFALVFWIFIAITFNKVVYNNRSNENTTN